MDSSFKPATEADLPALIEIRRQSILAQPETLWSAEEKFRAANYWDRMNIASDFSNHKGIIYMDGNIAAGFAAWKDSYLATLFLLPAYQGKGAGSVLLKTAEAEIRKSHDHIWLFAHPYSEKFYIRHGFVKQDESENPFETRNPLYKFLKSLA